MRRPAIGACSYALLASLAMPTSVEAILSNQQARCVEFLHKSLAGVDAAATKQVSDCLKNHAKGKALVKGDEDIDTLEECVVADPKGKQAKAAAKAVSNHTRFCTPPPDGKLEDPYPPFGATGPAIVSAAAARQGPDLAHAMFSGDLDAGPLVTEDVDPAASKCQQAAWQATSRCTRARIVEFQKCMKDGFREKAPPGPLVDADALRDLCLGTGQGQPDYRGRIAKQCGDPAKGIAKQIDKKCDAVDLTTTLPACGVGGDLAATAACLNQLASCAVCTTINTADALDRNCDLYDDGADNGSCGCGDGHQTPAEECDDGNRLAGDGCSPSCQIETPDADGDGVPDIDDVCPGQDDTLDSDGDTAPDCLDVCPGQDDLLDADLDTVPDCQDVCPGQDDLPDGDADGVPDCQDLCPGQDDSLDSEADGVPDCSDNCPNDHNAAQEGPPVGPGFACSKTIFISSAQLSGNIASLGNVIDGPNPGLEEADFKCQQNAQNAGSLADPIGTYKAWMSDNTTGAIERMTPSAMPYVRVDGVVVADDLTDLLNCSNPKCLKNPLQVDQFGVHIDTSLRMWTGTLDDGTPSGATCGNWTVGSGGAGSFGHPLGIADTWTDFGTSTCNQPRRIICVEQ